MTGTDTSSAGSRPGEVELALEEVAALHPSRLVRSLLVAAGVACVVVGAIGVFVPLLPTTPFLLVAAACFARASPAFHRRLLGSRRFGPLIVEWQRHRSIPWRAKLLAIVMLATSLTASIVLFVRPVAVQVAVALMGVALAVYLYRIPSRDRPAREGNHSRPASRGASRR